MPDANTLEQNRLQLASIIKSQRLQYDLYLGIALSQTVFIKPDLKSNWYVADSPHIALAAFDKEMKIIDGCFISKGYTLPKNTLDISYNGEKVIGEAYTTSAYYQNRQSTEKHFFESASRTVTSTASFSNCRNASKINNSGGDYYIIFLPNFLSVSELLKRIDFQKASSVKYDRRNDNCGHAILNVLTDSSVNALNLSTQEALRLSLGYLNIVTPNLMRSIFKTPFELGSAESLMLQNLPYAIRGEQEYASYLKSYLGLKK